MLTKIKLSPHFTLAEMLATQTFNGKGFDYNCESLTPEIYNNLVNVCNHLEEYRSELGIPFIVNSGFRCPSVNNAVGGATKSDHLTGCAVDISLKNFTTAQMDALCFWMQDDARYFEFNFDKKYVHISFYPYA